MNVINAIIKQLNCFTADVVTVKTISQLTLDEILMICENDWSLMKGYLCMDEYHYIFLGPGLTDISIQSNLDYIKHVD